MKYHAYTAKQWEIPLLLSGQRTQFRKPIKKQPNDVFKFFSVKGDFVEFRELEDDKKPQWRDCIPLPYKVGQRLWVMETLYARPMANFLTGEPTNAIVAAYLADDEDVCNEDGFNLCPWWDESKKLSAMAMPRYASRITLEITNVRVQRLQDISEEDAIAEGVTDFGNLTDELTGEIDRDAVEAYELFWERLNAKGSWGANPYVWAVTHKRVEA